MLTQPFTQPFDCVDSLLALPQNFTLYTAEMADAAYAYLDNLDYDDDDELRRDIHSDLLVLENATLPPESLFLAFAEIILHDHYLSQRKVFFSALKQDAPTLPTLLTRDLENELPTLCEQGAHDVESAIMRFAHGDCHDLTVALMSLYNAPAVLFQGRDTQTPVHSCIVLPNGYLLDGYGIGTYAHVSRRYQRLSWLNLDEALDTVIISQEWHDRYSQGLTETPEAILDEFSPVLTTLSLDLNQLYSPEGRHEH